MIPQGWRGRGDRVKNIITDYASDTFNSSEEQYNVNPDDSAGNPQYTIRLRDQIIRFIQTHTQMECSFKERGWAKARVPKNNYNHTLKINKHSTMLTQM